MSAIEWTDKTWNPVVGCSLVSAGCDGCYAARDAFGRLKANPVYAGLAEKRRPDELPRFTGEVRTLGPDNPWGRNRLEDPLHWREPARVFVNSMSDLFHEDVPEAFVRDVWQIMRRCPQHQFQILTKRPEYMRWLCRDRRATPDEVDNGCELGEVPGLQYDHVAPNVWLGTSIERQPYANIRIPPLLETPAAVRFLSIEPLLGPVDLRHWLGYNDPHDDGAYVARAAEDQAINWVIVGGESGPRARPMNPDWARTIRDQCNDAGIPFLFKQWGKWAPWTSTSSTPLEDTHLLREDGTFVARRDALQRDGDREYDLIDRGHPGWTRMHRPGKKLAAGRTLDGRTWDEYPA